MYDVQNIFHNYMSNLSNKEMPVSETRHYLVELYEPNFCISTGHTAKFGELENCKTSVLCALSFPCRKKRMYRPYMHRLMNFQPTSFYIKFIEHIINITLQFRSKTDLHKILCRATLH
jgi:hypothetical protein